MKWVLKDNELFIADRVVLSHAEKKLFKCLSTFKSLSLNELCIALRLPTTFTLQVMKNLNNKINFYYTIVRCRPPEGNIDIYFRLKRRR